jgi:hypothetical protein
VYGVAFVHCTVTVPAASMFDVMEPDEPKLTPVADTVQLGATVAVHSVEAALAVLLPVGHGLSLYPYAIAGDALLQE